MTRVRLALCQIDTVVGDIDANTERILSGLREAEDLGADVVAFPELAITGYPPEDLLLKPAFLGDNLAAMAEVAKATKDCVALVGFVDVAGHGAIADAVAAAASARNAAREDELRGSPRQLRNALAICAGGASVGTYHKRLLPNYGVFDEDRWFAPGTEELKLYELAGVLVGVSICEDLWFSSGPVGLEADGGARLVVNINASPYSVARRAERLAVARERIAEAGCAIAYVNQVGGQDELVFDGGSFVLDSAGDLIAAAAQFEEAMLVADVDLPGTSTTESSKQTGNEAPEQAVAPGHRLPIVRLTDSTRAAQPLPPAQVAGALSGEEEVFAALVLGTRDYLAKNGFTDAVIGLSGGIDSSLVAVIAVEALGPDHVHGISMPSRYSSAGSVTDAKALADNLAIDLDVLEIERAHVAFSEMLVPVLGGAPTGLCDENLQSRIRGVLLMAVSNAKGWIVLTTGNKSELATGYSTLYGDSAGGFAVIKDVPKTLVYELCRYRNEVAGRDLVPRSVLKKAPSAELRPDQRDADSLPPYEVLDPVLERLVAEDRSIADVTAEGFDAGLVTRVARLVDAAEYKRRQSPPGVRISAKAFGKDRRMPITNRYTDRVSVDSPPDRSE